MDQKNKDLVKSTLFGTVWIYASRYSGKFINLVTITILARLLLAEDFGVAGYATVVISFLDLPGLGIGPSLIYHEKDEERTNTGFWLAIAIGLFMFFATMTIAPLVGIYFQDARAVPVTRALSFYFPLVALGVVPSAHLNKALSFNRKFIPDFVGSLSKGVVSVSLAWLGFGAWSLVFGNLVNTLTATIVLWLVWPAKWRPSFRFNFTLAGPLFRYGMSIISVYFLGILLLNVDYMLVGRYMGAVALGIYMLAFRIPELLIKQFYSSIGEVLFPVFTKMRDEPGALNRGFLTSMRYVSLLTAPLALGLALVSRPLILTFFGEKWVEAIPVMSAIAIYTLLRSIYFSVGGVFKAQGRPEILSKLHLVNLLVLVPVLWVAVTQFGTLTAVGWAQVIVVLAVGTLRLGVAGNLLDTSFQEIIQTFSPVVVSSAIMAVAVLGTLHLFSSSAPVVQLVMSILVGAISYSGMLWWLQRDVIMQARQILRTVMVRS